MKRRIRRYSHRRAMIDACRLMGYTIEPAADKWGPYPPNHYQYVLVNPVGNVVRMRSGAGTMQRMYYAKTFRHMWQAACHALELEKVDINALKPPREAGDSYRLERAVCRDGD